MKPYDESPIAIRRLCPNDVEDVSRLIRNTLNDINSKDYSERVIRNLYDYYSPLAIIQMLQDRLIFVATKYNRIVGTVSLKENYILTLFVDSTKLHQGIGTLLMKHVESLARQNGHSSVTVLSSFTAYPFYLQLGYQTANIRNSEKYGQVIVMEKRINYA